MEPQNPPFFAHPDPEEPIEVTDYYEAIRMDWLSENGDEVLEEDPNLVEPVE